MGGNPRTVARRALQFMLLAVALMACLPSPSAAPLFDTPTETSVPTATIDWFPATATSTVTPSMNRTATPAIQPAAGAIILSDKFARQDVWEAVESDSGSAAVSSGRLTLAAQPGGRVRSLRESPSLDDFYVEVTAQPNLCRGADSYGLLIRATTVAYYRFSLTCDGMAGAERVVQTRVVERHVLQEPVPSGDVPPGAPGSVRIGVWASGNEMRLFLNDRYQFTVSDATYNGGLIGLFAESASSNAVTVAFTDLSVSAVSAGPAVTPAS